MTDGLTAELLAGAEKAFAAHGYQRCTLEQIASAAGISRVTLHRRGITKQALLAGLADRALADYQDAMWPVLISSADPPARLTLAVDALLAQAERHLVVLVALGSMTDEIFHEPEMSGEQATRSVYTDPLVRIFEDGRADNSLRVSDPQESATTLFNMAGWAYIHLRTGHRWAPERAATAVRATVLHGYLHPDL